MRPFHWYVTCQDLELELGLGFGYSQIPPYQPGPLNNFRSERRRHVLVVPMDLSR